MAECSRPVVGFTPTAVKYGQNFRILLPALGVEPIAKVSFLRLAAVTPGFDQNQRYVPLDFTQTDEKLSVQAPADGSYALPGYYMLFLISEDGVPSVAKYVQLVLPSP